MTGFAESLCPQAAFSASEVRTGGTTIEDTPTCSTCANWRATALFSM